MYIVLNNKTQKFAVIKDKTEISGYTNININKLRYQISKNSTVTIDNYTIITPEYVKVKSNSGGKRDKKSSDY